jgi:hypothetical protein
MSKYTPKFRDWHDEDEENQREHNFKKSRREARKAKERDRDSVLTVDDERPSRGRNFD